MYALGVNSPDYIRKDGVNYRVIKDHLGSIRMIVNTSTGEAVKTLRYSEYGETTQETGAFETIFGFAGGIRDTDTGLTKFGARWYDPEVGRWISKEPLGFEGAMNFYSYCDGDPVNFVDVNGLDAIVVIDHEAKAIKVILQIYIYGSGASDVTAEGIKSNINSEFGGNWRVVNPFNDQWYDFLVDTRVLNIEGSSFKDSWINGIESSRTGENYLEIISPSHGLTSKVENRYKGIWRGSDSWVSFGNPSAHEAGHLLGLKDRYKTITDKTNWSTTVMAEPAGKGGVNYQNIMRVSDLIWNSSKGRSNFIFFASAYGE